ncbi:hypothetical protein ACWC4D_33720 [Streptomyces sp. NPDC001288]
MLDVSQKEVAIGDEVTITDASLNFGDMYGRAAVLKEIRDDEDGFNYRVRVIDLIGLTTYAGIYETWVSAIGPAFDRPTGK